VIGFLGCFALGLLVLWVGWSMRKRLKASMSWPCVPGRVVSNSVRFKN